MNELEQRLEAQFQARISRLEEANRELQKFSYRAAHDLQQELRTISTFMSLAEESRPKISDPKFEKYLAVSKEGATRMQALVHDILAYVRAGSEPPNLAAASLSVALRWARYALAANLKEMNAEIEEDSLGDADIDVGEIGVVFQNLLANAIKFRKEGERPRIRIAGSKMEGGADDEWAVSVRDEGIGFDPQYSRKIFEPFERLHGTSKYPGTGIGLAICKKIVQAHGGRIWAEGRPGEGATFYFTVTAASTAGLDGVQRQFMISNFANNSYHANDEPNRILVVDDDEQHRELIATMIAARGWHAETGADGEEALEKIGRQAHFNAIVTDLAMPRMDGLRLLMTLLERGETTPAIVLTGLGDIGHAVTVVRDLRAFWYLQKPVDPGILGILLERAVEYDKLLSETALLRRQAGYAGSFDHFVGRSAAMQRVYTLIQQVAPTNAPVLITGESGTGKELAARAIHRMSSRAEDPFVVINCAALPEALIESEMFGHERGAFTGALVRRQGCFEQAHRGTLFLDEITEMPAASQAKLLRVLQDGKVRRLGGSTEIPVDVRLIAATNRSPEEAVREKRLREDIYYRLNVFGIAIPSLRQRKEDIPALTDTLIRDFNDKHHCTVAGIDPGAIQKLMNHSWPGNVRELRNIVERAVIMTAEGDISLEQLPAELGMELPEVSPSNVFTFKPGATLRQVGQAYVEYTLSQNGFNKRKAAKTLDISERTLYNRLEVSK